MKKLKTIAFFCCFFVFLLNLNVVYARNGVIDGTNLNRIQINYRSTGYDGSNFDDADATGTFFPNYNAFNSSGSHGYWPSNGGHNSNGIRMFTFNYQNVDWWAQCIDAALSAPEAGVIYNGTERVNDAGLAWLISDGGAPTHQVHTDPGCDNAHACNTLAGAHQLAIWAYMAETNLLMADDDNREEANRTVAAMNGANGWLGDYVRSLVNTAKSKTAEKPVFEISNQSDIKFSMTNDDRYYVSNTIKINKARVLNAKISVVDEDGNPLSVKYYDNNGVEIQSTEIANYSEFYTKICVQSLKKGISGKKIHIKLEAQCATDIVKVFVPEQSGYQRIVLPTTIDEKLSKEYKFDLPGYLCKEGEPNCTAAIDNEKCECWKDCPPCTGSSCPGKDKCKNSSCNNSNTGFNIIYREIDNTAKKAFPGLTGKTRETGANWCYWQNNTKDCNTNNETVRTYITNKGNAVYDQKPIYTIKLDASTMKSIRNYNSNNKYSDFKLNCDSKGYKCRSSFLHGTIGSKVTGTCDSNGHGNEYYTCAGKTEASGGET